MFINHLFGSANATRQGDMDRSWAMWPTVTAVAVTGITLGAWLYRKIKPILYPPVPVSSFNLKGVSPEVLNAVLSPPLIEYLVSNAGSREDALALSQCNRAAFYARFLNPHMGLHFKTTEQVDRFWFYCGEIERAEEAAHASLLRQAGHLAQISTLSLDLSDGLSIDDVLPVIRFLSALASLNINITEQRGDIVGRLGSLFMAAPGLKHLSIVWPDATPTPTGPAMNLPAGLWNLTSLETLTLRNLVEVDSIPDEIGRLQELKALHIHNLSLRNLPESIGQLQKLQTLELSALEQLIHLPDEVGRLSNLISLKLNQLYNLTALPDTLAGLPRLARLKLKNLSRVSVLPESIGALEALRELALKGLHALSELPLGLGRLQNLQKLVLEEMPRLTIIPDVFGSLTTLTFLRIKQLSVEDLPDSLWRLPVLQRLELVRLTRFTEVPADIGALQTLTSLTILNLSRVEVLPIGQLKQLQHLALGWLPLNYVPEQITQLHALRSLELFGLQGIRSLPQSLSRLKHLKIRLVLMREDLRIPSALRERVTVEDSSPWG